MEQVMFIQTGTGTDVHGQNITKASVRAIQNAIHSNSMPGIKTALPNQSLDEMKIHVKLALPTDHDQLDEEEVKQAIPYGQVTLEKNQGGMLTSSRIFLEDKEDQNDMMYIVNTAVEVGY
ncbi:Lin0512 family protein [Halobacillus naozhouensis]|uniref:Lin0512 family protein n=1 Tax=Halobacillus naozhouensis TaxID=554880 RepID=A0ABY8J1E5_9BACI|nr:Lin0512 family protein [Halobacillus naozhouensis]WFT75901.1 Lin0512 family protein [Halobacillus naozhouensis]